MNRNYTNAEIIEKLKWFHGKDFEKYPLADGFRAEDSTNYAINPEV